METSYTEKHEHRDAKTELFGDKLVKPREQPSRAKLVRFREVDLRPLSDPNDFRMEPINFFRLTRDVFSAMGADIARAHLPSHFVMESGYEVDEIGVNAVNVLQGAKGTP